MRFQPRTSEEIEKEQTFGDPFPRGEYDFWVKEASDERSEKTGNDMIHLVVQLTNDDGHKRTTHDYLLEAMSKKLRSFCEATGLLTEYEAGELSARDCTGQEGRAKVDVEKAKGDYPAKNVIREYLPRTTAPRPAAPAPQRSATPSPAAGNGSDARTAAWKQFVVKWNAHLNVRPDDANNRDEAWLKAILDFYPGRKSETLTSAEWVRVGQAFKVWDPMKGFPNNGPSQAPPFAENQVFQDSDIPF